jgi:hypothetical protein
VLVASERLVEGSDEGGDGLLATGQVAIGGHLGLTEPAVGHGQELLGVTAQGLGGELGEGPRKLAAVLGSLFGVSSGVFDLPPPEELHLRR